jgi:glycosyltransferase involved in cell wall biosynthesis
VPQIDLPTLYSEAFCFIYPSYFEGFGLPPLEAMQCGNPVITGNRTSLPEIVGESGLMVDPFDEHALASALAQLIDDVDLRVCLRTKGLKRARMFDWRETARLTLQVYNERRGRSHE